MKEYEQYFQNLPPAVKEVIKEVGVEKKLQELAKEYKLHYDKWIPLENEVMLALVGATDPELLVRNISDKVGIDVIEAQSLVEDIGEKIFKPINERLQDLVQGGKKRAIQTLKESLQPQEEIPYKDSNIPSSQRPYSPDDPYREPL